MAKQLQNTIEAKVANLDSKNQPMEPMVVSYDSYAYMTIMQH